MPRHQHIWKWYDEDMLSLCWYEAVNMCLCAAKLSSTTCWICVFALSALTPGLAWHLLDTVGLKTDLARYVTTFYTSICTVITNSTGRGIDKFTGWLPVIFGGLPNSAYPVYESCGKARCSSSSKWYECSWGLVCGKWYCTTDTIHWATGRESDLGKVLLQEIISRSSLWVSQPNLG